MQPLARIAHVDPESPADDAGFYPGCAITAVDGHPIRDIIDWRWHAAGDEMVVSYVDGEGDAGEVELFRDEGEAWGFDFEGAIFDDVIECCNACIFCFMRQLPKEARGSLVLRDDDYRLSFLQGNFVTFTNMTAADELRVIEQRISPLRFSLHCVDAELRRSMIGKHAAHGMQVAERLLAAGIELHAQIVLMPGVNDGEQLVRTLEWAYERPGILNVGVVPLGYTKHQRRFDASFNDAAASQAVIGCIESFQQRAMREREHAWAFASDEFYRNAYGMQVNDHLPPTAFYGDFEMFEDGIGILRSFLDDWRENQDAVQECARALDAADARVIMVYGCAMVQTFKPLLEASPLAGRLEALFVENDYFGGNVDVTGLLCGCDIAAAVSAKAAQMEAEGRPASFAAIPQVIFNADGVTLDDMTLEQLRRKSGVDLHVVSCDASEYLRQIAGLLDCRQ